MKTFFGLTLLMAAGSARGQAAVPDYCNGIQSAPLTITAPDGSVSPPIYTATVMTPDGTTMADGLASTLPACGGARRVEEERQMLATTVQLDISIVNLQGVSHIVPGTTTTITFLNKLDEFIKLLPELGLEVKYSACIAAKTCKKVSLDITPVVVPTDPGGGHSGGDPWVEGYLGQHFYIEGEDGWYAVISTPFVQLNLKMTKFNDNAGQIYWTGASVQHFSEDGTLHQSLLIDTVDHKKSDVSCADIGATSPCIGNGGVSVLINGVRHTTPAEFETTKGHQFAAANLPYECKHKTKTYMAEHPAEDDIHRVLPAQDLQSFIVGRLLMDDEACAKWLADHHDVFSADGEQATILFSAPTMTTSLEYYKYAFEGQQYYRLDVSTLNLKVDSAYAPEGIIGETMRARFDAKGEVIMSGQVLKADTEHYMVEGPFGRDFHAKLVKEVQYFTGGAH